MSIPLKSGSLVFLCFHRWNNLKHRSGWKNFFGWPWKSWKPHLAGVVLPPPIASTPEVSDVTHLKTKMAMDNPRFEDVLAIESADSSLPYYISFQECIIFFGRRRTTRCDDLLTRQRLESPAETMKASLLRDVFGIGVFWDKQLFLSS